MRVVVQRVSSAAVRRVDVDPPVERRIGSGLVLLAGFRAEDDDDTLRWMAEKCLALRIFPDDAGGLNRSVVDCGGSILAVPNFTLYADARKGRRPSFTQAAPADIASQRFDAFAEALRRGPIPVETGFFQAHMHVEIVNDGPVTLFLEK
ncbi:MAG: D-aminoacyl-tRNA deacylase [Candidatus Krumholzibacteriia bacterium]